MVDRAKVKLVGIYGSPRQGGNSDMLLDAALNGAEEAGADVGRLYLRDLRFEPCVNCGACSSQGVCRVKDDMTQVYDALDNSDVIMLGAPIYFASLCAQVKAMIDRCQPYWAREHVLKMKPPRAGRTGGFVCCCGFRDDRFLACTEQVVKTWYFVLHMEYRGSFFVPRLDALGAAKRHPTATEDAFKYGKRLASGQ